MTKYREIIRLTGLGFSQRDIMASYGVARSLVPDNCKTAVVHNGGFKDRQINETYQEMTEHYGSAIIPARVRAPKDKPNAEGTVSLLIQSL